MLWSVIAVASLAKVRPSLEDRAVKLGVKGPDPHDGLGPCRTRASPEPCS